MEELNEEDYLLLSGLQHFAFCPRQWALIHIENLWDENYLTASGRILHNKVHNENLSEKRGDLIIFRALKISSRRLGISGECDVVEFRRSEKGVPINNYEGKWLPYPVEYKRGVSKINDCDKLQLCAQAICLEEMLGCEIKEGALFYGKQKRRETVKFCDELRNEVENITRLMHKYFDRKYTPEAKKEKHCQSCSLKEKCLPKLCERGNKNIKKYLEKNI
jgi:CRISPR-associated exonuclease Cas4